MNKIFVLIPGYAIVNTDGTWKASSTTTLVETERGKVIVDPGCNRKKLLQVVNPSEVDFVFLTHHHLDHAMNTALFPRAKVVDADSAQDQDLGWVPAEDIFGTGTKIIKTPGHEPFHASLVVDTNNKGKICVAGDVFWWAQNEQPAMSNEQLIQRNDEFAFSMEDLKESRKKVLEMADWVIPGHGKMFKVEK